MINHIITCNYFLSQFLWVRSSRSSLAGQFWLRVSYEVAIKMSAGGKSRDSLTADWCTLMAGTLVLAVSRRPQFLFTRTSPQGCLSVLTIWWLGFPTVSDARQSTKKTQPHPLARVGHWPRRCPGGKSSAKKKKRERERKWRQWSLSDPIPQELDQEYLVVRA